METIAKGFVVANSDYAESDRVFTLITKDHGKLSLHARGVRKQTSKNRPSTELFTFGEYEFFKARLNNMSKLKKGVVIRQFENIITNMDRVSYGYYYNEIIDRLFDDGEYDEAKFNLYFNTVKLLNTDINPEVLFIKFNLEILKLIGVTPIYDKCAECGTRKGIYSISVAAGGLICQSCAKSTDIHLNRAVIMGFHAVECTSFDDLPDLNIEPLAKVTLTKITASWVSDNFDRKLNSLKLISFLK